MQYWNNALKSHSSNRHNNYTVKDIETSTPCKVLLRVKPESKNTDSKTLFSTRDSNILEFASLKYSYDRIFDESDSQDDLYEYIKETSLSGLLDGITSSVITYGHSKSGKSHLLFGNDEEVGIISKFSKDLFNRIDKEKESNNTQYNISLSILELYLEKAYDLLCPITSRRALKFYHDNHRSDYSLKDQKTAYITSYKELMAYITDAESTRLNGRAILNNKASKSHVFIRINVEQRNVKEDTLKYSSMIFTDLASSDIIDKNNSQGIAHDDIKKINMGTNALKQTVKLLSEHEKGKPINEHVIPYKTSNLTKLLYEQLIGNCKTTIILTCCNKEYQKENVIELLEFGNQLKDIETQVTANKFGLNPKKKMEIFQEHMKLKEDNYKSRLIMLKKELELLKTDTQNKDLIDDKLKQKNEENTRLNEQLETLRTYLKGDDNSSIDQTVKETTENIMQTLMDKCEHVAQLQLLLDDQKHRNFKLIEASKMNKAKIESLETMNFKLLDQINSQEQALTKVLTLNATIKDELSNFINISKTQEEKIKALEESIKIKSTLVTEGDSVSSILATDGTSSSSVDTYPEQHKASSWGFGSNKNSFWNNAKKPSAKSNVIMPSVTNSSKEPLNLASYDKPLPKPMKKGLNLHSLRIVSGQDTPSEL